jgi:hypothetical protein
MLERRKNKLEAEIAALRDEIRELRRAVEPEQPPTPLPGEGEVVELLVDQATQIADERDDLARQLADAKRKLAELEKQKPRRVLRRPFST